MQVRSVDVGVYDEPGAWSVSLAGAGRSGAARVPGPEGSRTGAQLYPGLAPGSEPFWPNRDPANPFPIPIAHYKWLVFADPNWDWKTFAFTDPADYEAHVKAEAKFAPILNATEPNLRAFQKRGGKLIQYHGWVDQLISIRVRETERRRKLRLPGHPSPSSANRPSRFGGICSEHGGKVLRTAERDAMAGRDIVRTIPRRPAATRLR